MTWSIGHSNSQPTIGMVVYPVSITHDISFDLSDLQEFIFMKNVSISDIR